MQSFSIAALFAAIIFSGAFVTPANADRWRPLAFADIPAWQDDDHLLALQVFKKSCASDKTADDIKRVCRLAPQGTDRDNARRFFEAHFTPHQFVSERSQDLSMGRLTGYFEPEVQASREQTADYSVPLYRRPADLVAINNDNRPDGFDRALQAARRGDDGTLVPHYDRAEIEAGALAGRNLELVWLRDTVDAFFIHIQGSARLALDDGTTMRVGYAAKSGHPFTAIGRLLVERGELDLQAATMAGIRAWLKADAERGLDLMHENRSFIFFAERADADLSLGPVGAMGVPLTPGRSIAIDPQHHLYGAPIWLVGSLGDDQYGNPLANRLVIAQDTGSAIKGPQRADFFVGSGAAAGELAGRLSARLRLIVLVPREAS